MTEAEKAAESFAEAKMQATRREWGSIGDALEHGFLEGAAWQSAQPANQECPYCTPDHKCEPDCEAVKHAHEDNDAKG